jgi:flagellar basal body-associated protein FliL
MAYDEEKTSRSKMVVETPTAHREVTQTERQYVPERNGMSTTLITVLVVLIVAVVTMLVLLVMNGSFSNANNANVATAQASPAPPTTIVQQPAQQPPVIVQQPAPATQQPPIIVNPPAPAPATGSAATVPDDASIQATIDKKLQNDPALSSLDVTATVANGKVTLVGTVKSEQLKNQIERLVRAVKGVKSVDNQIVVGT